MDVENAIKKVLVRVISVISQTDEITSMNASNIVTEVDVHFEVGLRLDGFVARSEPARRGLGGDSGGYAGSAANLTEEFASALASAATSGNLTRELIKASSNITGVNITANENVTASSSVSSSTIVVAYTRPPSPVPRKVPSVVPSRSPTSLPSYTLSPTFSTRPTISPGPSVAPTVAPTTVDAVLVSVEMEISTSDSTITESQKAELKNALADQVNISLPIRNPTLRNFQISSRRRLRRRKVLASKWYVEFGISVSLAKTGYSTAESWKGRIATELNSASFTNAIESLSFVTVASYTSSTVVDRNPTVAPTARPTLRPTPSPVAGSPSSPSSSTTPQDLSSSPTSMPNTLSANDDDVGSASTSGPMMVLLGAILALVTIGAGVYFKKRYNWKILSPKAAQIHISSKPTVSNEACTNVVQDAIDALGPAAQIGAESKNNTTPLLPPEPQRASESLTDETKSDHPLHSAQSALGAATTRSHSANLHAESLPENSNVCLDDWRQELDQNSETGRKANVFSLLTSRDEKIFPQDASQDIPKEETPDLSSGAFVEIKEQIGHSDEPKKKGAGFGMRSPKTFSGDDNPDTNDGQQIQSSNTIVEAGDSVETAVDATLAETRTGGSGEKAFAASLADEGVAENIVSTLSLEGTVPRKQAPMLSSIGKSDERSEALDEVDDHLATRTESHESQRVKDCMTNLTALVERQRMAKSPHRLETDVKLLQKIKVDIEEAVQSLADAQNLTKEEAREVKYKIEHRIRVSELEEAFDAAEKAEDYDALDVIQKQLKGFTLEAFIEKKREIKDRKKKVLKMMKERDAERKSEKKRKKKKKKKTDVAIVENFGDAADEESDEKKKKKKKKRKKKTRKRHNEKEAGADTDDNEVGG